MGTVIRFPVERRASRDGATALPAGESASIVILPVVRIERHSDDSTKARKRGRALVAKP